jgi:hypothetical protein
MVKKTTSCNCPTVHLKLLTRENMKLYQIHRKRYNSAVLVDLLLGALKTMRYILYLCLLAVSICFWGVRVRFSARNPTTCKGILRQVFICLRSRIHTPPPFTHYYTRIQYTYSHRKGGEELNEREG